MSRAVIGQLLEGHHGLVMKKCENLSCDIGQIYVKNVQTFFGHRRSTRSRKIEGHFFRKVTVLGKKMAIIGVISDGGAKKRVGGVNLSEYDMEDINYQS